MRITEVSATLRYSAEAKGAWRSIELGATATLTTSDETLEQVQAQLYQRLSQQLRTLWANGNGKDSGQAEGSRPVGEGHQTNTQPAQASTPPPTPREHWCSEHNQEYKKRSGPYGEFYSHQIKGSRQFCNEKT